MTDGLRGTNHILGHLDPFQRAEIERLLRVKIEKSDNDPAQSPEALGSIAVNITRKDDTEGEE